MGSRGIKTHKEDWKRDQRKERGNKKGHQIESKEKGIRGRTLVRKVDNTEGEGMIGRYEFYFIRSGAYFRSSKDIFVEGIFIVKYAVHKPVLSQPRYHYV
jgi:hypothetical protein